MNEKLLPIPAFLREIRELGEDDIGVDKYYRGVRAGEFPVIKTGPKAGLRMTVDLWRKFKRGEPIDRRFFRPHGKDVAA